MTFDVAKRLADARGAIGNTQTLVSACASVGYQHPDLTSHGAQIAEWFGSDDGLDLGVLDADCERLRSALTTAEEAMRLEDAAAQGLNSAWSGASGSAAAEFVASHRRTAFALVELVRSAAGGCASLRDTLWRIVDTKVAAAIAIDDRPAGQRTAWLAAARTVMTGGQDRAAAVEIIEKAVVPYVDCDIRVDWIDAMRSARDSASRAYREALNQSCRSAAIDFDLPGHLVPVLTYSRSSAAEPPLRELGSEPGWPAPSVRALPTVPVHPGTVAAVPAPETSPADLPTTTSPITGTSPFASPPGGLSSGLSEVPSFDGLKQSGWDPPPMPLGRTGDPDPIDLGVDDPNGSNADPAAESHDESADPDPDPDPDSDEADKAQEDDEADAGADEHAEGGGEKHGDQSATDEGSAPEANQLITAPEQGPPPTGEPEAGRVEVSPDVRTPCEIAADELPQVGQ